MKISIKIQDVKTVNELPGYWTPDDYKNLLKEFGFADVDQLKPTEILEYLKMAIADYETAEAAEIVLTYKLSDQLNEGQIQNISNEMLLDKIAEEYPDPALHYDLYNINQLLFKAYNGKFPNTEATIINLTMKGATEITKEIIMKALAGGLRENSLILRLFHGQLDGTESFGDAQKVIWSMKKDNDNIEIITSHYWMEASDMEKFEYETELAFHESED
jgi:hypothetical protein